MASFDQTPTTSLFAGEAILTSGPGEFQAPFILPISGVVYATNARIFFGPAPFTTSGLWWRWWSDVVDMSTEVRLAGGANKLIFADPERPPVGFSTSRGAAKEIKKIWQAGRGFRPNEERCEVIVSTGPDLTCSRCGRKPGMSLENCEGCGRVLEWPEPIAPFVDALRNPDSVIPPKFPDGADSQGVAVFKNLSVFAIVGYANHQPGLLQNCQRLLDAIRNRSGEEPQAFGDLPLVKGMGAQEGNERTWRFLCGVPSKMVVAPQGKSGSNDAEPPPTTAVPAGWYPDHSAGVKRFWDGSGWTEQTAPLA